MNVLNRNTYESLYFLLLEHGYPLKRKAAVLKQRQQEETADQHFVLLLLQTCIDELKVDSPTKSTLQDAMKYVQGGLTDTEMHVSFSKQAGVL
jgi:hypothetical protein